MSFEKKALGLLVLIGTIIGGVLAFAGRYETKEGHAIDIKNVEETTALRLENAILRIEGKLDKMEAQHHPKKKAQLTDTEKVEVFVRSQK